MRRRPAMIFAAGFGTRMGQLIADCPKPLLPLGETTLLDHTLDLARAAGISPIVVNAHYRASQIAGHLAGTDVTVLVEEPDILDTGGGLKAALPALGDGPVYTSNSDAAWHGPNPFFTLDAVWTDETDALLLLVPVSRALGRTQGDFSLDRDGRIGWQGEYVYTGVQILRASLAADVPDRVFSMRVVWNRLIAEGSLRGTVYPGRWCDVGTPDGLLRARAMQAESSR